MDKFNNSVTYVTDEQFEVAAHYLDLLGDDEALLSLLDMKITSDVWCKLLNGGIPQNEFFNTCESAIASNHNKLNSFTDKEKSCRVPTNKVRKHEYPWYVKSK